VAQAVRRPVKAHGSRLQPLRLFIYVVMLIYNHPTMITRPGVA
jgi:hypothetical protein